MKKSIALIFAVIVLLNAASAHAAPQDSSIHFPDMIEENGAVMILLDPFTHKILSANKAACRFFGYSAEKLQTMNISDLNSMTSDEIQKEAKAAADEHRSFQIYKYRLANGEIRLAETYSYPAEYNGKTVYFTIISDITDHMSLVQEERSRDTDIIFITSVGSIILLGLVIVLIRGHKKLQIEKDKVENLNQLRQDFIDADEDLVYLKDETLRYVFVNRAFENFHQLKAEDVIGRDDESITDNEYKKIRRDTDLAVLQGKKLITEEREVSGRIYKIIKFPVKMTNGNYGIGAYVRDVSEERKNEKKLQSIAIRYKILADVLSLSFQSQQEQLDYALHKSLNLTDSQYGYIYLYNEETHEFILNSWTNGVMENCAVMDQKTRYQLEKTGIWGEVVRQKKPIVVNEFDQPNPLKKGYPEGHVQIRKFMSIPVIVDGDIVAVVGLANKPSDYDDNDVYGMIMLMSGVWNAVRRREIQASLTIERNKYLQTLISIGDGVMVVDKNGNIEMLNTVAQKLTGWAQEEAFGKHYKDVFALSCEVKDCSINDPIAGVLETDMKQELGNHAILTSRDGTKYHLEDSAAPIRDNANATQGVVLVFRDVTDKKEQRKKIEYLSFHDSLTGLYNRRFFEEELHRIDTEKNLPISIIMGDVNSLKLTNDVFGHTFGDILLEKLSEVLKNSCRTEDIIARWGGDEFVVLLPQTGLPETKGIVERIQREFKKQRISAIRGSISMGFDCKQHSNEDIVNVLNRAEEKMYLTKTLDRDQVRGQAIEAIITTLHKNVYGEKDHSIRVSEICEKLGRAMNLEESNIHKLKEAGYLHDIGKIVIDPKLLNKNEPLNSLEHEEIKKHTTVGYRILSSFDDTMDLAESVLAHHERYDGKGYPKGLAGDKIPLLARIISVAESYDCMVNDLVSHRAVSSAEAIQKICEKSGTQFDPKVVAVISECLD